MGGTNNKDRKFIIPLPLTPSLKGRGDLREVRMKKIFLSLILLPSLALAQPPVAKSFDSKQPIEITSDSLEVLQNDSMATFVGNVVAIQGDVRLKSDKMTVYYAKKGDDKAAAANSTQQQSIKKIDVDGNVFLSTPDETAGGARGNYDVIGQEIHLQENVTLTRGKNVLKGNNLTYNFASGRSVISGGDVAEQGTSKGKQRVRALFVPDDKKPEGKKP